jgi:hypothetical protein
MSQTKECIMCFSEIDARAKKCRYCNSFQAKYSNLENNPAIMALLFVFIVGTFGYIYYDSIYLRGLKKEAQKDLIVSVSEVSEKVEAGKLYVACMGTIKNPADFRFGDVELEARFFNSQNELIDTIAYSDEELTIPANGDVAFRVRGEAQKETGNYSVCKVNVLDAWAR